MAQASAQPFKNNCDASAIASKIIAAQVPTSAVIFQQQCDPNQFSMEEAEGNISFTMRWLWCKKISKQRQITPKIIEKHISFLFEPDSTYFTQVAPQNRSTESTRKELLKALKLN